MVHIQLRRWLTDLDAIFDTYNGHDVMSVAGLSIHDQDVKVQMLPQSGPSYGYIDPTDQKLKWYMILTQTQYPLVLMVLH